MKGSVLRLLPFVSSFVLALLVLVPPLAALSPETEASIRRRLDDASIRALAIYVVEGKRVERRFWGSMSESDPRPPGRDSLFEIGSITKVFTALLLQDMADEGLVGLDDPVDPFLPVGVSPGMGGKAVTFRHLASHRSSLPRLPANFAPADPLQPYADYDEPKLHASLSAWRAPVPPGTRYAYSNLGSGLLGHLLTLATGSSYEKLLQDRITGPLGMNDSGLLPTDDRSKRGVTPFGPGGDCPPWRFDVLAPCGAMRSTPEDMLRFLQACLGRGPERIVDAIRRCHGRRFPTGTPGLAIATGWHVWSRHGRSIVWHDGGTYGSRSFIGFRPDGSRGVLLLAAAPESPNDLALHVLDPAWPLAAPKVVLKLSDERLRAYEGVYDLAGGGAFTLRLRKGRLEAMLTGQSFLPLDPIAPGRFAYRAVPATLTFELRDGLPWKLVLHQGQIVLEAVRRSR